MVILLYGLSGSGKTTLANEIKRRRPRFVLLDGDVVRSGLNSDLGLSHEDRLENNRRIAEVAKLLDDQGIPSIISTICPTEEIRKTIKDIIGNDLIMFYISTPLEVCKERDVKGLYAAVGDEMTGMESVFEDAKTFDHKIDTSDKDVNECANDICRKCFEGRFIPINGPAKAQGMKKYNFFSMPNMWKVDYEYKFAFPIVAKCASTQMREWVMADNVSHRPQDQIAKGRINVRFDSVGSVNDVPEGFIKFAIYRDPIERFYSACHFPGYDANEVIKEFTGYTLPNGICKDQHMRRQSDYYKLSEVDYVVKLEDLNTFLDTMFNYNTESRRIHKHPVFEDVDLTLSEDEMKIVKDYYAADWEIAKSDKVWKKPEQPKA